MHSRSLTRTKLRLHCATVIFCFQRNWLQCTFRAGCFALMLFVTARGAESPFRLVSRRWQMEDGLPQNSANAVLQTHEGYIWVATYAGLARFDGHRFQTFGRESSPRLPNERITALFEDRHRVLWIGCETGELFSYTNGKFEGQKLGEKWTPTKIAWICSDENDAIWVLDRNGVLVRAHDGFMLPQPVTGDLTRITNGLAKEAASGELWALRTGVVGLLHDGKWVPVALPGKVGDQPVQAIGTARDGGIWIVAQAGLFRWDHSKWVEAEGSGPWSGLGVNSICEWQEGMIAFGSLEQGLYLYRPGKTGLQFGREQRVGDNWIQNITVDREGSLWVGTAMSGVSVLQRTNYERIVPPENLGMHPLKTIAPSHAGGVWLGTEGGGIYRFVDGDWTAFKANAGLTNLYVWSVLEDQAGRLWAGTWGGGVFRLNEDKFERVPGLGDPRELVAALFEARDGSMWIGTVHGLQCYANGEVTRYGVEQGIKAPEVRSIAEDAAGVIWFGLAGGRLGSLRDGKLRIYGSSESLSADYIISLFFDDSGALWFGSTSGGLTRFKNGKFALLGGAQGFPSVSIAHIADDKAGNFWLSTDRGIFRIARAVLDACADGTAPRLIYDRFGSGVGMERIENAAGSQPAGCVTADGNQWYPDRQSIVRVDPYHESVSPIAPSVVLEEFLVDGKRIASGVEAGAPMQPLEIAPGHGRYEFNFTAPTYLRPESMRFRYRLAGLNNDWIDAGADRHASYNDLSSGAYRFEVTALDGEQTAAVGTVQLAFSVKPHLWERWWVRLLGYLAAALAIAAGARWQQHRSHRRKTEVLERQQTVERERTRIARDIHDDLGASLTRISLLSQSARRELDDPAQSAHRIDNIYSTASELTHKMDEIVWAINPRHDSMESVVNYFTSFAQELLTTAGVACRMEMPLRLPVRPIYAEARHHLFLAFKEALHNVVKHAGATCATISLQANDTVLELRVQDDGRGLNGSARSTGQGNGLTNMRQRLADVGGRCEISAHPAGGTLVVFYLPLRSPPFTP